MILPPNIVIVEDEVITQRYLQDIFTQHAVNVVGCFDNAKTTLAEIKHMKCDMILMDINIKGPMDGIQLAREILRTYTIPIVFITAHNDDDTVEELLELAPYGLIAKPFSSKEVLNTLKIAYKRYLTQSENKPIKEKQRDIIINNTYIYSQHDRALYENKISVKLNQKQSLLLDILIENINHTVGYDILISHIWGDEAIADSGLRTLIYSLRKLLPDLPIISYSKVGYMLEGESA